MRYLFGSIIFAMLFLLAACGGSSTGPPAGWETADGRWWAPEVDTSDAFRDLETLAAMDAAAPEVESAGASVERRVRTELMPLFRNNPRIVDSLFNAHVLPLMEDAGEGDIEQQVTQIKNDGYQAIRNHYREPQPALTLGEDVGWHFPDSLRRQNVGGPVRMQVYLDADGEPQAIALREGVHPVLDREAMRVASEMRWEPAGVRDDDDWRHVPSWTRYTIRFPTN